MRKITARWQAAQHAMEEAAAPAATLQLIHDVLDASDAAGRSVQQTRQGILEMQAQAEQIRTQCEAGASAVDQAIEAAVKRLFVRNGLPFWEPRALASSGAEISQPERFAE